MKLKSKLFGKRMAAMICSAMLVVAVPFTAMAADTDSVDPSDGSAQIEEGIDTGENTELGDENIGTGDENIGSDDENIGTDDENIGSDDENTGAEDENIDETAAEPTVGDIIVVGNYQYTITGDNTVSIGGFAEGCSASRVVVKKKITYQDKTYKVTAIEKMAFLGETKIKTVIIRKNVTDIGRKAFCKCTNLTKVTMRTGVSIIRKKAFKDCSKLATVNIRSTSLTAIKANAFKNINSKAVINVQNKKMKTLVKAAVPSYVTVNRV